VRHSSESGPPARRGSGERFRLARRFFSARTGTPEERQHICFDCPYLLDWHDYLGHLDGGGARATWLPRFDSNQRFHCWTRLRSRAVRPVARTG